jgi:site-specific recombinase XerD
MGVQTYMSQSQIAATTTDIILAQPAIGLGSWIVPGVEDGDMQAIAWQRAKDAWLESKRRKSGSASTVRAYQGDWTQFFTFVEKAPWNVSSRDADAWIGQLQAQGTSQTSINRKLAALSSFFQFVIDKFTFVGRDQIERTIYIDSHGNPRGNPFRKPERFKVDQYNHSSPMSVETVKTVLKAINAKSLLGSRDHALIVAYLYTGRRSSEIANLRWEDIDVDDVKGRYYYTWLGKGAKGRTDELPAPAYHAILNFLRVTGRLATIQAKDYIFQAVYADRAQRLPNVRSAPAANRPISGSMINRIVKRHFVKAGVPAASIHTHTLRHTAAHLRYRDGAGQDLLAVSRFLNHSSVAITQIYLSKMQKPVDTGWTEVEQLLMY